MTKIVKMVQSDPGDVKKQVFPQTHADAVIGLDEKIEEILKSKLNK